MASRAITIRDMKDAIDKKVVPGAFSVDDKEFKFFTIESVNSRGKKLSWTLYVKLYDDKGIQMPIKEEYIKPPTKQLPKNWKVEITVDSKQEGGKTRDSAATIITAGKNIGKKNETNIVTQALRDALSLYNKQKKKIPPSAEMKDNSASEEKKDVNSSGEPTIDSLNPVMIPPPMAMKKMGDSIGATLNPKDFDNGITLQRKYNGVRVVAMYDSTRDTVLFYSRSLHNYPGMNHIREQLKSILSNPVSIEDFVKNHPDCAIEPSRYSVFKKWSGGEAKNTIVYLDGEFYKHGYKLRDISGQSRKEGNEMVLDYYIYDCFFPTAIQAGVQLNSRCRQLYLDDLFNKMKSTPNIRRVENSKVTSITDINNKVAEYVKEGYEGAVARKDAAEYKYSYNNYKSDFMVKIKPVYDAEFKIIGITEGKGKDKGALIWIAEVDEKNVKDPNDKTFNVTPKDMSLEERKRLFSMLSEEIVDKDGKKTTRFAADFLGKPLTVEYSEISDKTGKPLQAKAITVRTYEDPSRDVLKKLAPAKTNETESGPLSVVVNPADIKLFPLRDLDTE